MAIPNEAVLWAYRLLLGREPENAAVVNSFGHIGSVSELRETFVNSAEFKALTGGLAGQTAAPPVGRYMMEEAVDIETTCSPEDLQRMLDGIAFHWRRFGQTEPHWSVLVDDSFKSGNIAQTGELFYRSGGEDIAVIMASLSRSGIPTAHFEKALDFGCGVGRLTLALAPRTTSITGVDISSGHLALAEERAAKTGIANARFAQISAVDDLARYADFDLIVSLIVLQHNPPPVMAELLRHLLAALRPGGVAVIQIPTYIAGARFTVRDYLASEQVAWR